MSALDREVKGGVPFDRGVRNLLEKAFARRQGIMDEFMVGLDEFAETFRSKFAGLYRKSDGMKLVVTELLGKATGNSEAAQMAKPLRKVMDLSHARYKSAGGIIGKLDNYFPQAHSKEFIKSVSFEEWYNFLRPRLDTDKMTDIATGLPFTEEKLINIMRDNYEEIITDGASELQKRADEGKQTFGLGSEVSQRKQSSRFYFFKDADSFLEYNDKFGVGESGLYDAVFNQLESFARDTGILETLGPKPNAIMRHLDVQMAARKTKDTKRKWTNAMYDVLTGYVDSSVGDSTWWKLSSGFRNIASAAYLGSAAISAISDTAFIAATAKLNGLSATKTMKSYLKLLNPASSADRKLAKRVGYIADIAKGSAVADVRFSGDVLGGKTTSWLSQFTNRAGGLAAMTKAARDSIALEMQSTVAELSDKGVKWSKLDSAFRDNLIANDISEADWGIIGKAERFEPVDGVRFIRAEEISLVPGVDKADALRISSNYSTLIATMRNMASNEPTLRTRAITTAQILGDARRGTALRSFIGSTFQFKSFPLTVMFNHIIPSFSTLKAAAQGDFSKSRLQHAAFTLVGSTILGALALQVREIVKGKDTRNTSDFKFWGAAVAQGGGLGLFGDFLFSDYSRLGRGFASSLAGPTAGAIDDVLRASLGNLDRMLDDPSGKQWTKVKRDWFNVLKRNTPANNLWYSRLVVERLMFDQIERMIDPAFDKRQRLIENRMFKQTGQRYYWRKGKTSPKRAPKQAEAPRR